MGGACGGVVVTKAEAKKQDGANSRVWSGYDVHMHPQRANIPLQSLDKCVLIVEAISGLHC